MKLRRSLDVSPRMSLGLGSDSISENLLYVLAVTLGRILVTLFVLL